MSSGSFPQRTAQNDLPSVLCPARVDDRYLDGIKGLTESGQGNFLRQGAASHPGQRRADGDQTPAACLTFSFLTGQAMLAGLELTSNPRREGVERLEAIQYLDGVVLEPGSAGWASGCGPTLTPSPLPPSAVSPGSKEYGSPAPLPLGQALGLLHLVLLWRLGHPAGCGGESPLAGGQRLSGGGGPAGRRLGTVLRRLGGQ